MCGLCKRVILDELSSRAQAGGVLHDPPPDGSILYCNKASIPRKSGKLPPPKCFSSTKTKITRPELKSVTSWRASSRATPRTKKSGKQFGSISMTRTAMYGKLLPISSATSCMSPISSCLWRRSLQKEWKPRLVSLLALLSWPFVHRFRKGNVLEVRYSPSLIECSNPRKLKI